MSLEDAFHQPRFDVSGGNEVLADQQLPIEVPRALQAEFAVATTRRQVFPFAFACPSAVLREHGLNSGCTEIMSPWGDAVAERLGAGA